MWEAENDSKQGLGTEEEWVLATRAQQSSEGKKTGEKMVISYTDMVDRRNDVANILHHFSINRA